MQEFNTAVKNRKRESLTFKIDGQEITSFRPKDGQIAFLMSGTIGRGVSESEGIAAILDFFTSTLDEKSRDYIESRLLDGEDDFDFDEATAIVRWLIKEWSGRPTMSSSDSSDSLENDSLSSKLDTPVSSS